MNNNNTVHVMAGFAAGELRPSRGGGDGGRRRR